MKLKKFKFRHLETSVTVIVENEEKYIEVVRAILDARSQVEMAIAKNPLFYTSLEPINDELDFPVARRMCQASKLAGVGPMAAVAGGIAQYAVEKVNGILFVDNGGDIVMRCRKAKIGIFPTNLAINIEFDSPRVYSVCTSSGRYGHSISFGDCDAAVVLAEDGFIADAFATALGNRIKYGFGKEDIEATIAKFWKEAKKFVDGLVVVKDNFIGFAGEVNLVKAKFDNRLITR
jgi:ApbE superfamily uncharacterized protein (UPF0280 family)